MRSIKLHENEDAEQQDEVDKLTGASRLTKVSPD